jgi:hypothetical protein
MADTETPQKSEPQPAREPIGPGPLMAIGLVLLLIAAWCGNDFLFPKEQWKKEGTDYKVWMNGGMMAAAAVGALYVFVQAFIRHKKAQEEPASKKPDEPTLL